MFLFNRDTATLADAAAPRPVPAATFPSLFMALVKSFPLIVGISLFVGALVFFFGSQSSPKFISEAQILVEVQDDAFTRPVSPGSTGFDSQAVLDNAAIRSQVQLLQSYDLGAAVADKLDLANSSEFDPLLKSQGLVSRILVAAGLKRNPNRMTAQERVIDSYLDRLSVFPIDESRVITVRFRSKDPEIAAAVVNALIDEYLRVQREAKQATTRDATAWLSTQIDSLRERVVEAEQAVADFRAESGLLIGQNNTTLNAQQLSELNSQLILAQTQKSETQARAQAIRTMLASGRALDGSAEVLDSQLFTRLQERLISLRSTRSELLATLLPGHPRVREIDAEINGLRNQILEEMRKIAAALESEADVASAREASIRANLEAIKAQVSSTTASTVRLQELEREAGSQRELLESLLVRFREASARQDPNAVAPDARVISRPLASNMPAAPELGILMIAAMVMTALIVAGIITMRYLMRYAAVGLADDYGPVDLPPQVREPRRPAPEPRVPAETPTSPEVEPQISTTETEMQEPEAPTPELLAARIEVLRKPKEQPAEQAQPRPALDQPTPVEVDDTAPELANAAESAQDRVIADDDPILDLAVSTGLVDGTDIERHSGAADDDVIVETQDHRREPDRVQVASGLAMAESVEPIHVDDVSDRALDAVEQTPGLATSAEEVRARLASGGKTTLVVTPRANGVSLPVALALARNLGEDDQRVIVVDVNDTDESSRQARFGLRTLLSGRARFAHVIQRDKAPTVHLICADRGPLVTGLAETDRFGLVLEALVQTYDAVIMAASPILVSPEAATLAGRADQTVLVELDGDYTIDLEEAGLRAQDAGSGAVLVYAPDQETVNAISADPAGAAA